MWVKKKTITGCMCLLIAVLTMGILTGCTSTSDDLYQGMTASSEEAFDRVMDSAEEGVNYASGSAKRTTQRGYLLIREYVPYVAVFCVVIGIILAILSRRNKPMRRCAIFGLIIGGPTIAIVFVFGYGFFCSLL